MKKLLYLEYKKKNLNMCETDYVDKQDSKGIEMLKKILPLIIKEPFECLSVEPTSEENKYCAIDCVVIIKNKQTLEIDKMGVEIKEEKSEDVLIHRSKCERAVVFSKNRNLRGPWFFVFWERYKKLQVYTIKKILKGCYGDYVNRMERENNFNPDCAIRPYDTYKLGYFPLREYYYGDYFSTEEEGQ